VAQKMEPNLYDLKGVGVTVSYSTSSISGEPRLSFKKGRMELNFAGDEITAFETSIGTVVTVTIGKTVDRGFTTFSILLPSISLANSAAKQAFRTLGITTAHTTSIAGPAKGAQETYKALQLRGSAKHTQFLSKTASTST
jgi:hypothetical protein